MAFYDALTKPENIKDFYENDELIAMTRELTEMLRKNRTIDWQKTVALLKKAPRIKAIQSEVIIERNAIAVKDVAAKFKELFN